MTCPALGEQPPGNCKSDPRTPADSGHHRDPDAFGTLTHTPTCSAHSLTHCDGLQLTDFSPLVDVLRTSRLVLRAPEERDVPAIVSGCSDPEVARYVPVIPAPTMILR